MLKKLLLSAGLLLALIVPTRAFASYVCQTQYYPGANARIKLTITPSASCSGSTTTYWICEPTSTSSSCGVFRYTVDELLSLESSLTHAADTQQAIAVSTTTCSGGGSGCLYSVSFYQ
jgi:hypothetical protein